MAWSIWSMCNTEWIFNFECCTGTDQAINISFLLGEWLLGPAKTIWGNQTTIGKQKWLHEKFHKINLKIYDDIHNLFTSSISLTVSSRLQRLTRWSSTSRSMRYGRRWRWWGRRRRLCRTPRQLKPPTAVVITDDFFSETSCYWGMVSMDLYTFVFVSKHSFIFK